MSTARIDTVGRLGLRCFPINIEVDISPGLPAFTIVGLPDTIVQESKERIRSAIKNSGATFPLARITVNLAPSDVRKDGLGFDLAIAIGILTASEQVPHRKYSYYGELGLEGDVKPTRGVLSFLRHSDPTVTCYIPASNSEEAGLIEGRGSIFILHSLAEMIYILKGEVVATPFSPPAHEPLAIDYTYDFKDIRGQSAAKRACEIAAAGHHNIIFNGPPGAGKTLLARSMPSIMPPLTNEEVVETTEIYSIAGLLKTGSPINTAPFRSPHHSASLASLVGGGNPPRPGEITLAHNGILFLDEMVELPRHAIESLRQPLEDRVVTVTRAGASATFPAHFLLVAAVNPCPCGYKGDPKHSCVCSPAQVIAYEKKLSGPILDRIDLHLTVPAVEIAALQSSNEGEPSESIKKRVITARKIQLERYRSLGIRTNSQLPNRWIDEYCPFDEEARSLLHQAAEKMNISARAYHKIIRLCRTIADLNGEQFISKSAISEALQYRRVV